MKMLLNVMTTIFLLLGGGAINGVAEAHPHELTMNHHKKLTEEQKQELARLHKEAIEKQKKIIIKYVEYGVITEEKGKRMLEKTDKYYKELEEHDYIPRWEIKTH
ncbi:DUF2680 domain-containing protein [Bacillus salitolerans]|uniref:DUF2680 domain-containing protein n=1 Tax=Bacillus salitolerans TaxID=1437434 RepID=A0ABW4LVG5_9BACI